MHKKASPVGRMSNGGGFHQWMEGSRQALLSAFSPSFLFSNSMSSTSLNWVS